jgi:hypothetical protein
MMLPSPDFESGASTNSATRAGRATAEIGRSGERFQHHNGGGFGVNMTFAEGAARPVIARDG